MLAEVISFLDAPERRFDDRVEPRYLLVGADEERSHHFVQTVDS